MIKKISGLCLLCCLIIGIPLTVQAQNTDKNSPKKELVMDEDELVEALTKIGLAIKEMENENENEDDIIALSYLASLYSNNSSNCNQSNEVAGVLNARFDRLESLLYDMTLVLGNTNNKGKNIVIKRDKQVPTTLLQEVPNQNALIEELKKQVQSFEKQTASLQEQINALKKSNADSFTNSNYEKFQDQINLLNSELQRQNKILNKQGAYLTEDSKSDSEIARLRKSEEDLEKEIRKMREEQGRKERISNLESNFVAVVPVQKTETAKETPKEEFKEEIPEIKEPTLKKELSTKKEFLTETEPSKKSEKELGEGLSKKVEKKQIFFSFDSFKLSVDAKKVLDKIAIQINEKEAITATILGLSSPEGNPVYNKKLAQKRSKEVYDYLVSKGVSKDRIKDLDAEIDKEATVPSKGRRVDIIISF